MTFWRDGTLIAVALGCFLAGGFPQWADWVDPTTGDRVSEFRLGLPFSPSFHYVRRDYERVRGDSVQGGYQGRGRIHWLSWSMLLILIGAVSLANVRWRRQEAADPLATTSARA